MNSKALEYLKNGLERLNAEINVGDLVLANLYGDAYEECKVDAIESDCVKFLWGQVVVTLEINHAAATTYLIEKYVSRDELINDILDMVA
jgi:hypothetical protein